MSLLLDVLHQDGDSLDDLDLNQAIFEAQKSREVEQADILLNELLKVDSMIIFLPKDEKLSE